MPSEEASSPVTELIKIIPQMVWIALATTAFLLLYRPLLSYAVQGKLSEVSILEFRIKFAQESLAQAPDRAGSVKTPEAFRKFEDRIKRLTPKIVGVSILWVDDKHPTQNLYERKAFSALGINVDMVNDTENAMKMAGISRYDVVITDMSRPRQPDDNASCGNGTSGAGCGLLESLHNSLGERQPPTIVYSAGFDATHGTPAYAFGITNRTDHLLQYVLDAVERRSPVVE